MRIVVFGAGSLGSLVGGLLTRRHEVVLIGRRPHVQAIEESGLVLAGMVEAVMVPRAQENVQGLPPADLVIITVKSYDAREALEAIRPLVSEGTLVVSLQNGLRSPGLLNDAYPGRSVIGVTSLGATSSGPGRVYYAGEGDTFFGVLSGDAGIAGKVADAFNSVGLDSYVTDDIMSEVWAKAIINSAINPITAIARCKNGRVLKDPDLLTVAESACTEGGRIAEASGVKLSEEMLIERLRTVLRKTSENKSSMLQDIERRRRTEIEDITGELVRLADASGVEAPVSRTLLLLVRSISRYE